MVETPVTNPLRVFAFAAGSVAFMSIMAVFVKLAGNQGHSVVEIMFFRNALAIVPVLMLIQAHPDGFSLLKTRRPLGHLLRGCIGLSSMACYFWSFALLPLANATALQFAMPLMLTALSVPFLNEVVGKWRWGAVLVGFIGVLVIAAPTPDTNWLGTGVALSSALFTAIVMIIVRRLGKTEHALTIVFYFSLWGTIVSACLLPWFWTPPTFASFIYLIMTGICGGVAQVFLTKAYAEAPAAFVSAFSYLSIIFSAFFGWAVFSQVPTQNVVIGACIVIASGLFILYREVVMKRHITQDSVMDQALAPTEADEYGPEPTGQSAAGMTYHGDLHLPKELK